MLGGKLVAAGSATTGSGPDFARREDRAQALVLQSGRLVAVGSAGNGSGKQTFALARYLS